MAGTIEAVLFDFGGVFTPSPFEAVARFGSEIGIASERYVELVFGPYDEDTDHPWHRLERGEIALIEAREHILALGQAEGLEVDLFHALRAMAKGATGPVVRQPMVEATRRLREDGVRTALVTNNAAEFGPTWRPLLPLAELFDAVVDSSEVGLRKPDPRIYHHALEQVGGIAPERAVFLDDLENNVVAARALGMAGIVVGEPDAALRELAALTPAGLRRGP